MIWMILTGCGSGLPEAPDFRLCLEADGLDTDTGSAAYADETIAIAGVVVEVGEGSSPAACMSEPDTWVEIEAEDGETWWLEVDIEDWSLPVMPGTSLSITRESIYMYTGGIAASEFISWILDDGAPLLYAGRAVQPGDLTLPDGVLVSESSSHSYMRDNCGTSYRYDLQAQVDNDTADLPYAETVDLGGWRLMHGGAWRTEQSWRGCADWGSAGLEVASGRL